MPPAAGAARCRREAGNDRRAAAGVVLRDPVADNVRAGRHCCAACIRAGEPRIGVACPSIKHVSPNVVVVLCRLDKDPHGYRLHRDSLRIDGHVALVPVAVELQELCRGSDQFSAGVLIAGRAAGDGTDGSHRALRERRWRPRRRRRWRWRQRHRARRKRRRGRRRRRWRRRRRRWRRAERRRPWWRWRWRRRHRRKGRGRGRGGRR